MKLKKFIASIVATALVGTTMAITGAIGASAVPETYTAVLSGTVGDTVRWDNDAPRCTINGDGDYSLTFELNGATESKTGTGALILEIPDINIYDIAGEGATIADTGIVLSVNSITIDGNAVAYNGPSDGAYIPGDNGNCIRLNIYNVWGGNDVQDIDFNFTAEKDVTVNFNVSGLSAAIQKANGGGEETTTASDETTKADDTTKADGTTKKDDTTTKKDETTKSDGDGTTVAQEETTTATGDAGIAGIVLVCALTGAGVVASRKKD